MLISLPCSIALRPWGAPLTPVKLPTQLDYDLLLWLYTVELGSCIIYFLFGSDVSCVGSFRANTTSIEVDEDNLPFSDMVLKFAEKVSTWFILRSQ